MEVQCGSVGASGGSYACRCTCDAAAWRRRGEFELAAADLDGVRIAYEVIGEGRPWVITPGGRFSKDTPGVTELAEELARHGQQVVIWDRPNTGASDVHFSRALRVRDAGRRAGRAAPSSPDRTGDHRRRLRRCPGLPLTAARIPTWRPGSACCGSAAAIYGLMLLGVVYAGEPSGRPGRRDGGGHRAAGMAGGARAQSPEP